MSVIIRQRIRPLLWTPREVRKTEEDTYPRCARCSARTMQSVPIEAFRIADAGSHYIEVVGRCRGTCEAPQKPARLPKQMWIEGVRISSDDYSDMDVDNPRMQAALARQVAQIEFFDDKELKEAV